MRMKDHQHYESLIAEGTATRHSRLLERTCLPFDANSDIVVDANHASCFSDEHFGFADSHRLFG